MENKLFISLATGIRDAMTQKQNFDILPKEIASIADMYYLFNSPIRMSIDNDKFVVNSFTHKKAIRIHIDDNTNLYIVNMENEADDIITKFTTKTGENVLLVACRLRNILNCGPVKNLQPSLEEDPSVFEDIRFSRFVNLVYSVAYVYLFGYKYPHIVQNADFISFSIYRCNGVARFDNHLESLIPSALLILSYIMTFKENNFNGSTIKPLGDDLTKLSLKSVLSKPIETQIEKSIIDKATAIHTFQDNDAELRMLNNGLLQELYLL